MGRIWWAEGGEGDDARIAVKDKKKEDDEGRKEGGEGRKKGRWRRKEGSEGRKEER